MTLLDTIPAGNFVITSVPAPVPHKCHLDRSEQASASERSGEISLLMPEISPRRTRDPSTELALSLPNVVETTGMTHTFKCDVTRDASPVGGVGPYRINESNIIPRANAVDEPPRYQGNPSELQADGGADPYGIQGSAYSRSGLTGCSSSWSGAGRHLR
jgi:hypothetical protein